MNLSYFCTSWKQRHSLPLCQNIFSRMFNSGQTWKIFLYNVLFQNKWQVCLLPVIKNSHPPCTSQTGFVSCNTVQCIYNYHPALCVDLWELILRNSSPKNADILAIAIGVSNKVLCIWLESYIFQQTYDYGRLKISLQTWKILRHFLIDALCLKSWNNINVLLKMIFREKIIFH